MIYARIVKGVLEKAYRNINQGTFEEVVKQFDPQVHFTFNGTHALSIDTHSRDEVLRWFHQLRQLFPTFTIQAKAITVAGMPWNTLVASRFVARYTLADGTAYENHGLQVVRIVWGKVVEDHISEDTALLIKALQHAENLNIPTA